MSLWRWCAQHDLDDVDYRLDGLVEADTEEAAIALVRRPQADGYVFDEFAWDVWVHSEPGEAPAGEDVLRDA